MNSFATARRQFADASEDWTVSLWSQSRTAIADTPVFCERPHIGGPYHGRWNNAGWRACLSELPPGFVAARTVMEPGKSEFYFQLPVGSQIRPDMAALDAFEWRQIGEGLARLHGAKLAHLAGAEVDFQPPFWRLLKDILGGSLDPDIECVFEPHRTLLIQARSLLGSSGRPDLLCHGRVSIGSVVLAPNPPRLMLLTGPDIWHGPAESDLAYLLGEMIEAVIEATLLGNRERSGELIAHMRTVIEAYARQCPLVPSELEILSVARVAVHLAANHELLRRKAQTPHRAGDLERVLSATRQVAEMVCYGR